MRVLMETLPFDYTLLYGRGDLDSEPIAATEKARNVIAVVNLRGPVQAVMWDHSTAEWTYQPDIAAGILFAEPGVMRTRDVDRPTAEQHAPSFATSPLPTAEELTAIVRAARAV